MSSTSRISERALELLGTGISQEQCALALGVSPSAISQLLAREDFATAVVERRYAALQKYNELDSKYDSIEDKLLIKMERMLPFFMKPHDILNAIKTINGAKRRGQDNPDAGIEQKDIVQITLPNVIVQNFTTNIVNQVVKIDDQDLVTIQSSTLKKNLDQKQLENATQQQKQNSSSYQPELNTIESESVDDMMNNNEILSQLI